MAPMLIMHKLNLKKYETVYEIIQTVKKLLSLYLANGPFLSCSPCTYSHACSASSALVGIISIPDDRASIGAIFVTSPEIY